MERGVGWVKRRISERALRWSRTLQDAMSPKPRVNTQLRQVVTLCAETSSFAQLGSMHASTDSLSLKVLTLPEVT